MSETKKLCNDDFSEELFSLAFEKLQKQGYITKEDHYYKVTMDGLLFQKYGGYESTHQEVRIDSSRDYKEHLLSRQMAFLTRWIAVGTCVYALYCIFEVIKWICHK